MSAPLPPCRLCGMKAHEYTDKMLVRNNEWVFCRNMECHLRNTWLTPDEWRKVHAPSRLCLLALVAGLAEMESK